MVPRIILVLLQRQRNETIERPTLLSFYHLQCLRGTQQNAQQEAPHMKQQLLDGWETLSSFERLPFQQGIQIGNMDTPNAPFIAPS